MNRVLLVGKGQPDRGGISAFMQTLLASELATEHRLSLLNLYREEVLGGGRFTRANLTRTLADAARPVKLNHRFCAEFCVLGGASCSPHR